MDYVFHFDVIRNYFPDFLKACWLSIRLGLICIIITSIIGVVLGALLTTNNKIVKGVIRVYVESFRLTPFLVQMLFVYFGIPLFLGVTLDSIKAGVVTLGLNGGAYAAETFRAGFQSVPRTQMESALSIGLTKTQAYTRVIIPQGIRSVLPYFISSCTMILKDTSFFSIIGVMEATGFIRYAASLTYRNFELFTILGLFYIIFTLVIGQIGKILENRVGRHEQNN